MYKFELQTEELSDIQTLALATELKIMLLKTHRVISDFIENYHGDLFNDLRGVELQHSANDIMQLLELIGVKTSWAET